MSTTITASQLYSAECTCGRDGHSGRCRLHGTRTHVNATIVQIESLVTRVAPELGRPLFSAEDLDAVAAEMQTAQTTGVSSECSCRVCGRSGEAGYILEHTGGVWSGGMLRIIAWSPEIAAMIAGDPNMAAVCDEECLQVLVLCWSAKRTLDPTIIGGVI